MDNHQIRPSLANDPHLLDRLLDLDRGMGVADPVARPAALNRPSPRSAVAPPLPGPEAEPLSLETPVMPPGQLAARRRPWRTPATGGSSALDLFPSAPPVAERGRGPSIVDAPAPAFPPGRRTRTVASPGFPGPLGVADPGLTYESFYGFDEKPFGLSSDPKFLYHSTSFERTAQDVADAIARSEGIMLVTGARGIGKTTLCLSLVSQLGGSMRISLLTDPPASVGELFESVQESALVIIDEAQRLSADVLDQLYRLSEGGRGGERLQIVLVGEPDLLRLFRRRGFRERRRVITRCRLEPLTADEVTGYVAHRLAVAGTGVRVAFEEGATARLHAMSGGTPRVVNQLCDAALTRAHRAAASRIDRALMAAAADDLGLAVRRSVARSLARAAAMLLAFVALLLVGAAVAAWTFRDDLERAAIEWEARPPVPAAPLYQAPPLAQPTLPAE